jgi:prenyltransferase beta subunit
MSFRLEMLQVARLATLTLGDAVDCVRRFCLGQQHAAGGFMDREGRADLYYTVFGLDCLAALRAESEVNKEAHVKFVLSFGDGAGLDFVHLCCLLRCYHALAMPCDVADAVLARIEGYRTPDGGYAQAAGAKRTTAYAAFLAYGAYSEARRDCPEVHRLLECLLDLESKDGGFANEAGLAEGTTTATAAIIAVMSKLVPYDGSQETVRSALVQWFRSQWHSQGGFKAFGRAPLPDLLSTATTLHALSAMESPLEAGPKDACLDFIDTLWNADGGFHGHWADDDLDVEYTYYGLLALGHLT